MARANSVFWGCTFTHNYPFIIKSTKCVLDRLGIQAKENKEYSCCPDPIYLRTYGGETSLAISARNLALAEKEGDKLIVACNGCYNVLHEAAEELCSRKQREKINQLLPESMQYEGGLKVEHLLSILHQKTPLMKTLIKKPLNGLRVAAHYGCHALYPTAVGSDDPKKPRSLDEVIQATGAESIDYGSKLDCCGVPVLSFDKEEGDKLLAKKLSEIRDKADCIVTMCPACFMRFDAPPAELKDQALPVLHVSELLCLAFGVEPRELFPEGHSTKLEGLLQKIGMEKKEETLFDSGELESHCEACREECIAAVATRDTEKPFDPLYAVDMLKQGRLEELLGGEEIWRCLQCGKCLENCPNNLGLKDMYMRLREMALERGSKEKVMNEKMKLLEETSFGMPKRAGIRKRMNIEPAPDLDAKEIRDIIEKTRKKK